jgi:hypothetical protein
MVDDPVFCSRRGCFFGLFGHGTSIVEFQFCWVADLTLVKLGLGSQKNPKKKRWYSLEKRDRIPTLDSFVRLSAALGLAPAELLTRAQETLAKKNW